MSIKVKICGMREPDNILAVGVLQPDFMGFIFYPKSPRCVPLNFSMPIELAASIKKVGVFVNEKSDQILSLVKRHSLDFAQLHGNESVKLCEKLKQRGIGVIKVFSIDEGFDFDSIEPYKSLVDFFLFDAKGKQYGGNGFQFNWNVLNQYDPEVPFFLSGGISLENIKDVEKLIGKNLYAVDLNSGFEVRPGIKDVDKIKQVLKNLK